MDGQPNGLILNHAYSINDVIILTDINDKMKPFNLIRLRNPWGYTDWNGPWSQGSKEWNANIKMIEEYF